MCLNINKSNYVYEMFKTLLLLLLLLLQSPLLLLVSLPPPRLPITPLLPLLLLLLLLLELHRLLLLLLLIQLLLVLLRVPQSCSYFYYSYYKSYTHNCVNVHSYKAGPSSACATTCPSRMLMWTLPHHGGNAADTISICTRQLESGECTEALHVRLPALADKHGVNAVNSLPDSLPSIVASSR